MAARADDIPEDGTARIHSASGIALGQRCEHAWALRYIDKHKPPDVPWADIAAAEAAGYRYGDSRHPCQAGGQRGASLGKEVHARAEIYLAGTAKQRAALEWSDLPGQVLHHLIAHLPPAGSVPRSAVEHAFSVELCGVQWRGLIDIFAYDAAPGAHVLDHKTSKDILAYALLPDTVAIAWQCPERSLRNDLQACMYALYTAVRIVLDPSESVRLQWTYTETGRCRRSLPVVQDISASHALRVVREAADLARKLERYSSSAEAPGNTLACSEYGGCWQRGRHCFKRLALGKIIRRWELAQQSKAADAAGK